MKIILFEGTPEEFQPVAHLFLDSPPPDDDATKEHSVDPVYAIGCMLTRSKISEGHLTVFKALANGRLEYNDYLDQTGYDWERIRGVHGALSRRINNTEEIHSAGLPGENRAVRKEEAEGGKTYYSLTDHAYEALKAGGVI